MQIDTLAQLDEEQLLRVVQHTMETLHDALVIRHDTGECTGCAVCDIIDFIEAAKNSAEDELNEHALARDAVAEAEKLVRGFGRE